MWSIAIYQPWMYNELPHNYLSSPCSVAALVLGSRACAVSRNWACAVRTVTKGGGASLLGRPNTVKRMAVSARRSRFEEMEAGLEIERRARERQEREQGKGKRVSTLHRDSDFTLESPDGRVSPPPAPAPWRPPPPVRSAALRSSKTDVSVRYAPCPRSDGKDRRVRGEGERATEPALGEFERRLLNAKRLGKAPMPSVDSIPWVVVGVYLSKLALSSYIVFTLHWSRCCVCVALYVFTGDMHTHVAPLSMCRWINLSVFCVCKVFEWHCDDLFQLNDNFQLSPGHAKSFSRISPLVWMQCNASMPLLASKCGLRNSQE